MIAENKKLRQLLSENKFYLFSLAIYTFVSLFFCSKMSPLYPTNEWADINVYFNVGKGMFNGMTLYTEIFDHKGPLIFVIYGLGYFVSNTTFLGVFVILLLGWIGALISIFCTANRILNNQKPLSLLTAFIVPVFALSYMHTGGSAEEFILIAQLISIYFFFSYFSQNKTTHNPKYMLVHGITSATIFLLKFNLTAFIFFPLLGLFISILVNENIKAVLKNALYYLIGLLIIVAPILLYFIINGALVEAFNTYIVLNKELAITIPIDKVIANGMSRVYALFRFNTIEALLLVIGMIHFPIRYLKNTIGKITFIAGGFALCSIIFFAGVFHFYYPLPLYVFMSLGVISVLHFLQQYIHVSSSTNLVYFIFILCLLCAYNATNMFGYGGAALARKAELEGANYYFAKTIAKEENPTLLNLAFGDTNSIYTICNIVPNTRFFTSLNIAYEKYPILRNRQTEYIRNKATQFIIIQTVDEPGYFEQLPELEQNYSLVDTYSGQDKYQHGSVYKSYLLYKRKE